MAIADLVTKLTPLAGPVGMGLSVAGQIFGAVKAAKAAKDNQNLLNQKQQENEADYNNSANRSFLETNAAKDAVKLQTEALRDNQKAIAGRAAITGASDEAIVAGNSNVQKNYNDGISRIAAAGTQYQDNQKRMYLARKDGLDNQQSQLNAQKAEGAANLMGNASDLFSTVTFGSGMNGKSAVAGASGMDEVLKNRAITGTGSQLNKIAQSAFK
jgi:hypothetical protein